VVDGCESVQRVEYGEVRETCFIHKTRMGRPSDALSPAMAPVLPPLQWTPPPPLRRRLRLETNARCAPPAPEGAPGTSTHASMEAQSALARPNGSLVKKRGKGTRRRGCKKGKTHRGAAGRVVGGRTGDHMTPQRALNASASLPSHAGRVKHTRQMASAGVAWTPKVQVRP